MASNDYYLCLDQGGQSSRALCIDPHGKLLAGHQVAVDTRRDGPFVEQDPAQLVDTLKQAASEAMKGLPGRPLATGLAVQRSSCLAWDRDSGRALSAVIGWQDRRGRECMPDWSAAEIQARVNRTGLPCSAHYGAGKFHWLLSHQAELRNYADQGRLVLGPLASYLAQALTGAPPGAEGTTAGRTWLWGLDEQDWDAGLLADFHINQAWVPTPRPSLADWGHWRDIPLRCVVGDQAAAWYGACATPGSLVVNMGTGAFLLTEAPAETPRMGKLLLGARPDGGDGFLLEGTVNGAASALADYAERHDTDPWQTLGEPLPGEEHAPFYLNSFGGLGSPYWRPDLAPAFEPRPRDHRAALAAIAESVLFLIRRNLDCMGDLGTAIQRIVLAGGLSRSDALAGSLSALCGMPVIRAGQTELTALGVARLLGAETGDSGGESWRNPPDTLRISRYDTWKNLLERHIAHSRG